MSWGDAILLVTVINDLFYNISGRKMLQKPIKEHEFQLREKSSLILQSWLKMFLSDQTCT